MLHHGELHAPPSRERAVNDGVARVPVGDGPRRLELRVRSKHSYKKVEVPAQFVSVTTASHTLRFDDAALQAAIAELQKRPGRK